MDNSTVKKPKINTIEKLNFSKITHEEKGFTTHLNIVLQNLRNPVALAIWCYLSSLPSDWDICKAQIRSHFGIGVNLLDKALSQLKKAKLIEFLQVRNPNGTMGDGLILVKVGYEFNRDYENHVSGEKLNKHRGSTGHMVNRGPVSHGYGKQHQQKKENTNKNNLTKKTKSFCDENSKKHPFAESMNQMASEERHTKANEEFKRSKMPDSIKSILGIKTRGT